MTTESTLGEIITKFNLRSDKNGAHSYCDYVYEHEFKKYKNKPITLLELGIWDCSSLRLWAEYFTDAKIYGIDKNPITQGKELNLGCEFVCENFNNITLIKENGYQMSVLDTIPKLDIFIDDASHDPTDQLFSIEYILPKMNPGSTFIIEDIRSIDIANNLKNAIPAHLLEFAEVIDMTHVKKKNDDIVLIVRLPN